MFICSSVHRREFALPRVIQVIKIKFKNNLKENAPTKYPAA